MGRFDRNWFRAVAILTAIAMSSSLVVASRASSSRPDRTETKAQASRSSGGAAARSRGSASSATTIRAGGRASWRHGTARGGYVHVPRYRYHDAWWYGPWGFHDPWSVWGWHPWYGWYGSAAWAIRSAPTFVLAAREVGQPGWIETDVRPRRARVFLDGEDVGFAKDYSGVWDVLEVSPGRHTLEFRRDGYKVLRIDVDVADGEVLRIDRRLRKGEGRDPASVLLATEPAAGPGPGEPRSTPPGAASSATTRPRSQDGSADSPGEGLRRGLLRLDVRPDDAAVYLDGAYLASAGELRRLHGALPVAEGPHRIEVVRPGFVAERVEVEVRSGETARVEIRLESERP